MPTLNVDLLSHPCLCRFGGPFQWHNSNRHYAAMSDRFFVNTIEIGPDLDDPEVTRQILKAAAAGLKQVKAKALSHQDVSGGGIYVGLAGVALTYLRMAQQLQRGFE